MAGFIPDITREYGIANRVMGVLVSLAALAPFAVIGAEVTDSLAPVSFAMPVCIVKQKTGKLCPSCGLTRSVVALYKGDISASSRYHSAGRVVVLVLFGELVLRVLVGRLRFRWVPWADLCHFIGLGAYLRLGLFGEIA